ncbi:MAG: HAD family phosphatase [Patescibacteria group bacterium]|jgi:epoxide hydrolase-like predicted phosphatase|nr:HAD family phosphatase [Patescibacteria group bacterium]
MKNIKAIIFDYGGVITNDLDELLIQDIADKFQLPYGTTLDIINKLVKPYQRGTISDEDFWNQFSEKVDKKLPNGYESLWIDKYTVEITDQRVLDLIKKLKTAGYVTALLSNTIPPHASFNQKYGFFDLFEPIVLSIETDARKPEEKIYQTMLEKLNLSPGECVFIDDKKEYSDAASKVGIYGLKFDSYEKLVNDLTMLNVSF